MVTSWTHVRATVLAGAPHRPGEGDVLGVQAFRHIPSCWPETEGLEVEGLGLKAKGLEPRIGSEGTRALRLRV